MRVYWLTQWDSLSCCVKCAPQPVMRYSFSNTPADVAKVLLRTATSALPPVSVLLQTLGLPTELFQIVLAKAAQQHGTAPNLR